MDKLSSLQQRIITAIVMVSVLLAALYLGQTAFLILVALVCIAMLVEWWWMFNSGENRRLWMLVWPLYFLLSAICIYLIYAGFGAVGLLWVIVLVAAADTGAYFVGRTVGGPKLAPNISPNKTISGAVGGLISACIACFWFMFAPQWPFSLSLREYAYLALVASLLIAVASQFGDLFESYTKRVHNVKDSSNMLPGHGGFLDRLDGVLAAAPVAYLFLSLF